MSLPREGARDTGEGILVSMTPDVCRTPNGPAMPPIPYSVWAKQNNSAAATAATVRQTGMTSHTSASLITVTHGDAPGVGGGVKSGTVGSICQPRTWSKTVRFEGKNAVRHDDEWWMNRKNCHGQLTYLKDTKVYDPTPDIKGTSALTRNAVDEAASALKSSGIDAIPDMHLAQATTLPPGIGAFLRGPLVRPPGAPVIPRPSAPQVPRTAPPAPEPPLPPTIGPRPGIPEGLKPKVSPPEETQPQGEKQGGPDSGPSDDTNRTSRDKCPTKEFCFNYHGDKYDEFQNQLQMQNDGLNNLSPAAVLSNMANYGSPKSEKVAADAKSAARLDAIRKGESITGKAALHRVDQIAGGDPGDVPRMGDGSVNSSIGSSWRYKKEDLREHAEVLRKNNCPKMKVDLYDCAMRA